MNDTEALEREMLRKAKTIAVVGLSDKPDRSSFTVSQRMQHFYKIIPVNPSLTEVLGERCYQSLSEIPENIQIDLVNIFRRSDQVDSVVDEAIVRNVPYIWMQLGVVNEAAAKRAKAAGIKVIMDACIAVSHAKYGANL